MLTSITQNIKKHLINIPGWRTNRKIVVFESDDWGSIRMPSKFVFDKLLYKGIPVDKSAYCRLDSIASEDDLIALFDVLKKFSDKNGKYPVITANTVVCNPNFDKIKESKFSLYYFEKFIDTLNRYYPDKDIYSVWNQGMKEGLFYPQYHGREHVNVIQWLKLLREGNPEFREAFKMGCWGLSRDVFPHMTRSIQATYDYECKNELHFQKKSISEGLSIFQEIFGYQSKSFIANNFIWDSEIEKTLFEGGVNFLQGMKYQKLPIGKSSKRKMIRHVLGEKNKFKQKYLIRNCSFEPSLSKDKLKTVKNCIRDVKIAFNLGKPAIITTHRINYIGSIDEKNRQENLQLLKFFLNEITHKWDDLEFLSSEELGVII